MDIAALSIIKNQVQLQQDAGIAVLKKAIGTEEQGSSLVNQMLDKTVEGANPPHLGSYLDAMV